MKTIIIKSTSEVFEGSHLGIDGSYFPIITKDKIPPFNEVPYFIYIGDLSVCTISSRHPIEKIMEGSIKGYKSYVSFIKTSNTPCDYKYCMLKDLKCGTKVNCKK